MIKPVEYLRDARAELEAAAAWYEEQRPGLGLEFVEAVVAHVDDLPARARRCGLVPGVAVTVETRRSLLPRFPYQIVFIEQESRFVVLAVAHLRRRPGYWSRRTQ